LVEAIGALGCEGAAELGGGDNRPAYGRGVGVGAGRVVLSGGVCAGEAWGGEREGRRRRPGCSGLWQEKAGWVASIR